MKVGPGTTGPDDVRGCLVGAPDGKAGERRADQSRDGVGRVEKEALLIQLRNSGAIRSRCISDVGATNARTDRACTRHFRDGIHGVHREKTSLQFRFGDKVGQPQARAGSACVGIGGHRGVGRSDLGTSIDRIELCVVDRDDVVVDDCIDRSGESKSAGEDRQIGQIQRCDLSRLQHIVLRAEESVVGARRNAVCCQQVVEVSAIQDRIGDHMDTPCLVECDACIPAVQDAVVGDEDFSVVPGSASFWIDACQTVLHVNRFALVDREFHGLFGWNPRDQQVVVVQQCVVFDTNLEVVDLVDAVKSLEGDGMGAAGGELSAVGDGVAAHGDVVIAALCGDAVRSRVVDVVGDDLDVVRSIGQGDCRGIEHCWLAGIVLRDACARQCGHFAGDGGIHHRARIALAVFMDRVALIVEVSGHTVAPLGIAGILWIDQCPRPLDLETFDADVAGASYDDSAIAVILKLDSVALGCGERDGCIGGSVQIVEFQDRVGTVFPDVAIPIACVAVGAREEVDRVARLHNRNCMRNGHWICARARGGIGSVHTDVVDLCHESCSLE